MNDAPARPLPLAGYRILSAEQYGAAPYGTMFLAQLGADVVKIESPAFGDTARAVGPHFLRPNESLFFQTFNLNKRSITLDLKSAAGQEVFRRLAARSHAVANNQRGDLPAKLGLTYDALKDVNPAIVCAHLSAYGRGNSREKWPGYDYLMQAEAGFLSLTGEPDGPPTRFGLSMVDFMTGTMMSVGLLAALLSAKDTGLGRDVDVDLLSAALHQTTYPAMWYMNEGDVVTRTPRSSHPSVTPSQLFRTADGWIFVMAQLPKFWTVLLDRIGQSDLATDPRFAAPADRTANRDALTNELDAVFSKQPTAFWLDALQGQMPVAPVHGLDGALDSPFLAETGMVDEVSHNDRAAMKVLANPISLDGARLPNRAAPLLGADTDAVLAEAGFDTDEIATLRRDGIV
ncbi:CaiB/BaiF CoA transferase family protein [Sphingomonas radiodurans]|uniref:CaiB/BaiF CoA transferase family protein n=1 Tax=Sphingomonas radiodurans TaxID=2890321 RepID=UPI001E3A15DD|nr:CoA transferase [Sphingomonas radiodurans]WBH18010.1 CoA transferase [Sphingomonas radiodurans]